MKKLTTKLLTVLMLVGFSYAAQAQFAARVGVNLANQSFSPEIEGVSNAFSPGLHLGVTYEHMLSDALSLRPGVLFSMKGSKQEIDFLGVTAEATSKFNYLEIPIDFVYKMAMGDNMLNIHAGPYVGMLMTAKVEDDDVKEDVESLDYGLNLGLSYHFGKIGVGVNYGLGLANIAKTEDGDDSTVKNNVLALFASYAF